MNILPHRIIVFNIIFILMPQHNIQYLYILNESFVVLATFGYWSTDYLIVVY